MRVATLLSLASLASALPSAIKPSTGDDALSIIQNDVGPSTLHERSESPSNSVLARAPWYDEVHPWPINTAHGFGYYIRLIVLVEDKGNGNIYVEWWNPSGAGQLGARLTMYNADDGSQLFQVVTYSGDRGQREFQQPGSRYRATIENA
ncbi:hypothetical protein HJFPF1_07638 [Paramyrothecium foliicola]|nr:hypothetical protein HJFPF1_07638 [Paramyrothecium foliicola]